MLSFMSASLLTCLQLVALNLAHVAVSDIKHSLFLSQKSCEGFGLDSLNIIKINVSQVFSSDRNNESIIVENELKCVLSLII